MHFVYSVCDISHAYLFLNCVEWRTHFIKLNLNEINTMLAKSNFNMNLNKNEEKHLLNLGLVFYSCLADDYTLKLNRL